MAPQVGLEPTTLRLTVARTAKLTIPAIAVDSENTPLTAFQAATEYRQFRRRLPQKVPKVFSGSAKGAEARHGTSFVVRQAQSPGAHRKNKNAPCQRY